MTLAQSEPKKTVYRITPSEVQAIFRRRRHQPRRPPQARLSTGSPAPGDATGHWCGGIGNDDSRKVARDRIVVMEERSHKKSLENRRKIKEAQCPGARA